MDHQDADLASTRHATGRRVSRNPLLYFAATEPALMPSLYRLNRVFFIYLYQSWKYRTDYSRVNEFGQGGDEDEDDAEEKKKKKKMTVAGASKTDETPLIESSSHDKVDGKVGSATGAQSSDGHALRKR